MKKVWGIVGVVLLAIGLIWIVAVMGAVFSHAEGYTRMSEMWGPMSFHVVFTGLGMFCLGKAGVGLQAASGKPESLQPAVGVQAEKL